MKKFKRERDLSTERCMRILVIFGVAALVAFTIFSLNYFGVLKPRCPRNPYTGLECNGLGTCDHGVCKCVHAFVSGLNCDVSLGEGFVLKTGQFCNGNGYLGATHATKDDIPVECRESEPTFSNGYRKLGGWNTQECFEAVQGIVRRIELGTAPTEEVFSIPICQCYEQWAGSSCADPAPCILGVNFERCTGNGNNSVGFMDNITTNGEGCQCRHVNNHLAPQLLETYTPAGLTLLRQKFSLVLSHLMCGTLHQHPTKPDLKLVWNYEPNKAFKCFCDERHFGEACQFGVCPEDKFGRPCSGNGHPNLGFGAQINTTMKLSLTKSYTICSSSYVNCYHTTGEDRCVNDVKLCKIQPYCPSNLPVRCRDGTCVKKPNLVVSTYSYGLFENYTTLLDKKACYATNFLSNATYLTGEDYWLFFRACGGSDVKMIGNQMLPKGDLFFDTSLLVIAVESPFEDGSLTFTYRGQEKTVSGRGMLYVIFSETYEQELRRLYQPTLSNINVTQISQTEVDLYPSPFIYDATNFIPPEWQYIRLISTVDPSAFVVLTSSHARIEYHPDGDWFIANITTNQILSPSGSTITYDDCVTNFRDCIWNWNTKLNVEGTRKLCGSRTVSTNLNCAATTIQYLRLFTVLTAHADQIGTFDWSTLSPWHVGASDFNYEDFSFDGDWLTITPSVTFRGVNALSYVELADVAIPDACPPSYVNASVLNAKWIQESIRRSSDFHSGEKVVATYSVFGQPRLIRGIVASPTVQNEDGTYTTKIVSKGFQDVLNVQNVRLITSSEYDRGLPEESFRVFPGICNDGQPSEIHGHTFNNVTVQCDCDLTVNRDATCTCHDEHNPVAYPCTCHNNVCDCVGFGMTDLEQNLLGFLTEELRSVCFYSDHHVENSGDNGDVTTVGALPMLQSTDTIEFERPNWSAYLAEIRLYPCVANITVQARSSVFSDIIGVTNIDVQSSCIGLNQTIRPIYPEGFEDMFDYWYLSNFTTNTWVTPIFAPNGVPVKVSSVSVTSNDALKNNVLWNDLTYWTSLSTDVKPTITLQFLKPAHVTAIYVVLESVGVYVNVNTTLPSAIYVQATSDNIHWITLGNFVSEVVHGKEDRWFPLDFTLGMWRAIRLRAHHTIFGIREFVPLTNQRCDDNRIQLIAQHGFQSITSDVIERILSTEIVTESCTYMDNCVLSPINGEKEPIIVDSTSACIDAKWVIEGLGYPEFEFGRGETVSSLSYYLQSFLNSSFDVSNIQTYAQVYENPPEYIFWWGPANVTVPTFENLTSMPTRIEQDGIVFVGVNSTQWVRKNPGNSSQIPEYYVYRNLSVVERGLACPTGHHGSKCGNSDRTVPKNPGVDCVLNDYERAIFRDYLNRTDHVVKNSAPIDEYLNTGKVTARITSIVLQRQVVKIAPQPCMEGCGALLHCPTGECVESLQLCPEQRYMNEGDGCTRRTVQEQKYLCACKVGTGGSTCSETYCTPGDPYTGLIDPHQWCSCGPHPPLKLLDELLQAPLGRCYTSKDLKTLNRKGLPRTSTRDVGWQRVSTEFAPFGTAILRCYAENTRKIYTNCGFYVRSSFGQLLSLEECVGSRDPITNEVTSWKHFDTFNGTKVQYIWYEEDQYDDAPFRCFTDGGNYCVASEKDCYNAALIAPTCGVNGAKCRVDGTCDCPNGKTTFTGTKEWTDLSLVPYDGTNPTLWGTHSFIPFIDHCNARDCTDGKCSIPYGCFPGSKEHHFQDRHVVCPESSGHGGKCAVDFKACGRGEVTELIPCCGKGIPRQRDYRPEEYYCACGDPKSKLVSFLDGGSTSFHREITELVPNGWGGDTCEFYECYDDPKRLHYSRRDPVSLQPYIDEESFVLPGKWIGGSCNAPNGPSPDDKRLWQTCCPGTTRFERCNRVLCMIGGTPNCVVPEDCTGSERRPLIYPCHNKGQALADGTCDCQTDRNTGVGWGPDSSGVGCYRKITCPIAANGIACNDAGVSPKTMVIVDKIPYFESQIYSFFLLAGLGIGKQEMVSYLIDTVEGLTRLLESALVNIAIEVISQVNNAAAGICVYPNDDPAHPKGMLPYVGRESIVGPYGKAFKFPSDLTYLVTPSPSIVFDRRYQQYQPLFSVSPIENQDYTRVPKTTTLAFTLSTNIVITHIKLYGSFDSSVTSATIDFGTACVKRTIQNVNPSYWFWVSDDGSGVNSCQTVYIAYDFQAADPNGWTVACKGNEQKPSCLAYKDAICAIIPGGQIQDLVSLVSYEGCDPLSRCCIPKDGQLISLTPRNTFSITPSENFYVQEIAVFGYLPTYIPLPDGLLHELQYLQGGAVNPHHGGQSIDYAYLHTKFGNDGEYYVPRKYLGNDKTLPAPQINVDYPWANSLCIDSGGVIATARGAEDPLNYALTWGQKCFETVPKDRKCIIGARNRDEVRVPLLQDFFRPHCSSYGCYICFNGDPSCDFMLYPRIDYVSTPDDGTMWTTAWASGIQPWTDYMNGAYRVWLAQVSKTVLPAWTWLNFDYAYYTNPVSLMLEQYPLNSYDSLSSYPYNQYQIPIPGTPGQYNLQSELGGRSAYWTNNQTCKVTFYSEENCGDGSSILYTPSGPTGIGPQTIRYGYAKSYYVTPADDYSVLFRNLVGDVWEGTQIPLTGYRSNPFCAPISIQSVSIVGPCDIVIRRSYTRTDFFQFNFAGEPPVTIGTRNTASLLYPKIPGCIGNLSPTDQNKNYPGTGHHVVYQSNAGTASEQYRVMDPMPIQPTMDVDTRVPVRPGEDYPVIVRYYVQPIGTTIRRGDQLTRRDANCPTYKPSYWVVDKIFWADNPTRDLSKEDWMTGWVDTIRILPRFESYQVETNGRAEPLSVNRPTSSVTDDFSMGWQDFPFMCMRMDIRIFKGFVSVDDQWNAVKSWTPVDQQPKVQVQLYLQHDWLNFSPNENFHTSDPVVYRPPNGQTLLTNTEVLRLYGHYPRINTLPDFFPKCIDLSREVMSCPLCIVEQPEGDWEFDPRKYNPLHPLDWPVKVGVFHQTTYVLNNPTPRPTIYFTWRHTIDNGWNYIDPSASMLQYNTRAYARMIARVRVSPDYRSRFHIDNCVAVVKNPDTAVIPYSLVPTVCEALAHFALCQRDYLKHAIQSGRQCDISGPNTRPGGNPSLSAFPSVFDDFPLANQVTHPREHEIKDAYLNGHISDFIVEGSYDWNAVWSYIWNNITESLVSGAPGFWQSFTHQISTRPGYLSEGITEADYNKWVDVAMFTIWPVDCGERCSKFTGICHKRRALDPKFCDPDAPQTPLTELARDQYPLDLLPITADDAYRYPRCARLIDPGTYYIQDSYGGASTATKQFVVLEHVVNEYVLLRMTHAGTSTWSNTGKSSHGYVIRNYTTFWGEFACSSACQVRIWVSSISPQYSSEPSDKLYVGNFTTSPFLVSLNTIITNGNYYKTIGFDINGLVRGDTIKLYRVLASDPYTIADCRKEDNTRILYEPSSSINVADRQLTCLFEYDERTGQEPGTCLCGDDAFGGKTCESPSLIPIWTGEKSVCGGSGQSGYYTIDYFGDRVPVNDDGSWQAKSHPEIWGCATINVGLIFRTRLVPATRYYWQMAYFTERAIGQNEYVEVTPPVRDVDTGKNVDLTLDGTTQTCASQGMTLSSWYSGDESSSFHDVLKTSSSFVTFTDLQRTDNGDFRWKQRESLLVVCPNGQCGRTISTNPCLIVGEPRCVAYQYFNLAFNTTGTYLTDGTTENTQVITVTTTTVTLRRRVQNDGLFVQLWVVGTPIVAVAANTVINGVTTPIVCHPVGNYKYNCDSAPLITDVLILPSATNAPTPNTKAPTSGGATLTPTFPVSLTVKEIGVWATKQTGGMVTNWYS